MQMTRKYKQKNFKIRVACIRLIRVLIKELNCADKEEIPTHIFNPRSVK